MCTRRWAQRQRGEDPLCCLPSPAASLCLSPHLKGSKTLLWEPEGTQRTRWAGEDAPGSCLAPECCPRCRVLMWLPYYFCPKYTKCWLLQSTRNNTSPKMPFLTWEFAVKHWRDAFLPVMMMPLQRWNLGAKKNPIFWLLLITSPHFKEIFICLAWKISQAVFIRRSFVCQQWILLYYWKESKAKVPACTVNLSKQKMFLKKLRHYFYNKPQPNSKLNK